MKLLSVLPLLASLVVLASCSSLPTAPQLEITCQMERKAGQANAAFEGTCSVPCPVNALAVDFSGINQARTCAGPDRRVSASLGLTSVKDRWLGTMQGVQPEDPTRLEIVPNKTGSGSVARMPFGWFAVNDLKQVGDKLVLRVNATAQVRPNSDDLQIIDRSVALLSNREVWNKNDTRQCPQDAKTLSMFCALMQATTEISGGIHYRQPAMQAVREELNLVDKARIKTHRIMDYNNHPDTTLDEIHGLLKRARARVEKDLR